MRVLVTGGAGFIGANLVRSLAGDPRFRSVTVLDDLSTGDPANLDGAGDVRLVTGSVCDQRLVDELVEAADGIVHLAARPSVPRSMKEPFATHEANATGTLRVLEAARQAGGRYVVVASSSSVYGANPSLPKHEGLVPEPLSPYAVSKLAAEAYTTAYAAGFGLPTLAFRFFNVFGPLQPAGHDYAAVVPRSSRLRWRAARSPSTATGCRAATSPSSGQSSPC
jgi:UDP-glucose 4-epimerase